MLLISFFDQSQNLNSCIYRCLFNADEIVQTNILLLFNCYIEFDCTSCYLLFWQHMEQHAPIIYCSCGGITRNNFSGYSSFELQKWSLEKISFSNLVGLYLNTRSDFFGFISNNHLLMPVAFPCSTISVIRSLLMKSKT